jgi:hypothetical protein
MPTYEVSHKAPLREVIEWDQLPEGAQLYDVAVKIPLPGGGSRIQRYEVHEDGSLISWHYCKPPHERDTTPDSPEEWTCDHCGEVWKLQVARWYFTPNSERDNATAYDY